MLADLRHFGVICVIWHHSELNKTTRYRVARVALKKNPFEKHRTMTAFVYLAAHT